VTINQIIYAESAKRNYAELVRIFIIMRRFIMPNKIKTPPEDFTRFENWLDGMTEKEFDMWYKEDATKKQRRLADTIREEILQEDI